MEFVYLAVVVGLVAIVIVVLLRDRITALWFDSSGKMGVKAQPPEPATEDEKPVGVVFKGNKLRGEGEYSIRRDGVDFSENDADGKQKVEIDRESDKAN
ncbi:MAG: hypothetical protein BJG00_002500 [Limnothrix sp. CACIAM 69d]|nr:MAG: hypothetical protein BJG00_002500 [Limnothrix sp. CACIAM 69d]